MTLLFTVASMPNGQWVKFNKVQEDSAGKKEKRLTWEQTTLSLSFFFFFFFFF